MDTSANEDATDAPAGEATGNAGDNATEEAPLAVQDAGQDTADTDGCGAADAPGDDVSDAPGDAADDVPRLVVGGRVSEEDADHDGDDAGDDTGRTAPEGTTDDATEGDAAEGAEDDAGNREATLHGIDLLCVVTRLITGDWKYRPAIRSPHNPEAVSRSSDRSRLRHPLPRRAIARHLHLCRIRGIEAPPP
ncbi:hypothetical protein BKA00_003383 [Actinomadura coerulea]|uniref:Uncharacterized protein n=1 Tax=Actinomadura coerulea TaxID=46159 RepID=A0A7X0KZS7_9ACTN|nr:hypothetical protein [Actinomadura coerulea]MBB6396469.1 hypothetical protein [Actinomadura coerulea]